MTTTGFCLLQTLPQPLPAHSHTSVQAPPFLEDMSEQQIGPRGSPCAPSEFQAPSVAALTSWHSSCLCSSVSPTRQWASQGQGSHVLPHLFPWAPNFEFCLQGIARAGAGTPACLTFKGLSLKLPPHVARCTYLNLKLKLHLNELKWKIQFLSPTRHISSA